MQEVSTSRELIHGDIRNINLLYFLVNEYFVYKGLWTIFTLRYSRYFLKLKAMRIFNHTRVSWALAILMRNVVTNLKMGGPREKQNGKSCLQS